MGNPNHDSCFSRVVESGFDYPSKYVYAMIFHPPQLSLLHFRSLLTSSWRAAEDNSS